MWAKTLDQGVISMHKAVVGCVFIAINFITGIIELSVLGASTPLQLCINAYDRILFQLQKDSIVMPIGTQSCPLLLYTGFPSSRCLLVSWYMEFC
jgi:hypothetical protein